MRRTILVWLAMSTLAASAGAQGTSAKPRAHKKRATATKTTTTTATPAAPTRTAPTAAAPTPAAPTPASPKGAAPTRTAPTPAAPTPATAMQTPSPPVAAKRAPAHQPAKRPSLSLGLGLEFRYDDNILQLTPAGLDRLDRRPGPPRFRIQTPDDNITGFHGDLRWRVRPIPRRETRFAAAADVYSYHRNDVKSWQQFGVSLQQELNESRHYFLATLDLWLNYMPNYYVGELTDADDSFFAGRRIRRSVQYAQTGFGGRTNVQFLHGKLEAQFGLERLHRDYDVFFDERDNDNDMWHVGLEARPFRHWGAAARVTYLEGELEARGDLPETPIPDRDISYKHHGFGGSVTLPWGHGKSRGHGDAGYMPETRSYTTPDKFDVTRFGGRSNLRHEMFVRITQRIWGPLEAVGNYYRLTNRASLPPGVDVSTDTTDWDQNRWSIMIRGRWEFLPR